MSSLKAAKSKRTEARSAPSGPMTVAALRAEPGSGVCVGWISQVDDKGRAYVDFVGNKLGPVAARSICTYPEKSGGDRRRQALLVFEGGDPTLPIIVGMVRETLFPETEPANPEADTRHTEARVLTWEAKEFLELRCGSAAITLTNDGRAEVRGREIVSRASRTHKIRGGSVQIN